MKRHLLNLLYRSPFYPGTFFLRNPFKKIEMKSLLRGLPLHDKTTALDVGCGHGLQTNIIGRKGGRILGIDPHQNSIDWAISEQVRVRERIQSSFRCATIQDADLADGSFDFVFSVCVLEHIPDDLDTLKHCHRVLKPGGWCCFSIDALSSIHDEEVVGHHKE